METLYIALVRHTLTFTYHDCQFVEEEFLFVPRFHRNLRMVADTSKHGCIEFLERVAMITLTQVIPVKRDRMCDVVLLHLLC